MADLGSDTVEYKILMDAAQAIQDLNAITASATTVDEKMQMVAVGVTNFAQKLGVSTSTAEALLKKVEIAARNLQETMSELAQVGAPMPALGPLQQQLMGVQPVFPQAVSPEMWKGTDVHVKEIQAGLAASAVEGEKVNTALEKAAASASGIAIPIKTAAESMASLRAFAEGQRGQGILQNFIGGYQGTVGLTSQVNLIKNTILSLSRETGASFEQTGALLKDTFNIPQVQITGAIKSLNSELGNVPKNANGAVRSIDAMRIALGALTAMVVFQVTQAFAQFFTGAIKNAMDLQGALYNVANAERIMSQQGIDIAPKDLQKMATELKALVPIMSQIDATKAVSSLALFTKDLGYTKQQISDLSQAVGTLYVRNQAMGLSFEQVLSQVQTGLLTGRAQGIRDLGVSISEAAIQQEALRMGLVKSEKEFQALTGDVQTQVKAQAMLSIIVRNTAQEQKDLGKYMETDSGKMKTFSASIEDFKTATGQAFLPVLGALAEFGSAVLKVYNIVQRLIAFFDSTVVARIVAPFLVLNEAIKGNVHSIEDIKNIYDSTFKTVNDWIKIHTGLTLQSADAMDTATQSAENLGSALIDMSKAQSDIEALNNSLVSMGDRYAQLDRDYIQNFYNYQDEQNTKMLRMQQDYQIEVAKTIQDFNDRRSQAEQKYRNNQIDAEAKFQEQLRELREKYLFDLEDALRARDARQVLRLQEQYRMDKENLEKNHALENNSRARQYKQELTDLKKQEQEKLKQMADAEKLKEARAIEDYNRETAQREQKYENEKADLEKEIDNKLHQVAQGIADEYGMRENGADNIYNLLKKYYGPNGFLEGLYDYSYNSLVSRSAAMLSALQGLIAGASSAISSMGAGAFVGTYPNNESYRGGGGTYTGGGTPSGGVVGSTNTGNYRGGGGTTQNTPSTPASIKRAVGGIDFATKPTTVTYGESGPETAIFLPQGKSLSQVPNNLPASLMNSMNGSVKVELELSPDLIHRITENTLGQAAEGILKIYRSRQ